MTKQVINAGTPGTTDGDTLRSVIGKVNNNFNDTYDHISDLSNPHSVTAAQIGALTSSTLTANEILTKLKTVDGDGSGLEADSALTLSNSRAISLTGDVTGSVSFDGSSNVAISTTINTSFATKTYVDDSISAMVDSAPETLDTLNELAQALGDDPNFATTVSNQIGGKVSKSGDTISGDIVPNAANTINIGSSSATFATMYATTFSGTAIQALYADVAERYESDSEYLPGTVVVIGGNKEITVTENFMDPCVAGVISTNPALEMNKNAGNDITHPYVALVGRVPCLVVGPVKKGDPIVTAPAYGVGVSAAGYDLVPGSVIGKSLENKTDDDFGIIEIMVRPS